MLKTYIMSYNPCDWFAGISDYIFKEDVTTVINVDRRFGKTSFIKYCILKLAAYGCKRKIAIHFASDFLLRSFMEKIEACDLNGIDLYLIDSSAQPRYFPKGIAYDDNCIHFVDDAENHLTKLLAYDFDGDCIPRKNHSTYIILGTDYDADVTSNNLYNSVKENSHVYTYEIVGSYSEKILNEYKNIHPDTYYAIKFRQISYQKYLSYFPNEKRNRKFKDY